MDNLFLLIPISAHGFIDFMYFDSDLKLGLYVFAIVSYGMIGLQIFKDMSILFFLMFSMYHFSKDFAYLDQNKNNELLHYCMGSLVITTTTMNKNRNQWNVILNLLTATTISTKKIVHFLEVLCLMEFMYVVVNMFTTKSVCAGIFISLYVRIFEHTKPLDTVIYYLAFFHVPINVHKHYAMDKASTNILFSIGLMCSSVFCILLDKKLNISIIQFALSVTTVHMVLHAL